MRQNTWTILVVLVSIGITGCTQLADYRAEQVLQLQDELLGIYSACIKAYRAYEPSSAGRYERSDLKEELRFVPKHKINRYIDYYAIRRVSECKNVDERAEVLEKKIDEMLEKLKSTSGYDTWKRETGMSELTITRNAVNISDHARRIIRLKIDGIKMEIAPYTPSTNP